MSAERPWMKFYPQDWRADERLRNCTLAARGLWMEMLALMHRSEHYGFLLINGRPPTDRQLANQVGASTAEVSPLLVELEAEAVFSRDKDGLIYSRRMKRDEKKSKTAKTFGKLGGNPKLLKQTGKPAVDKGRDKPQDNGGDKPHMPEARVQNEKEPSVPKKSRLPEGWEPEPFGEGTESREIIDGWSEKELKAQLEAFRAHHTANGSAFVSWQQAWSTWIINSRRFGARSQGKPGASTGSLDDKFLDAMAADYLPKKGTEE